MELDERVKQFNALVERIAQGDISALDEIYDGYGGLLYAMAKKYLIDKSLAEEVLGEVFCKLVKNAKSFHKHKNGLNWIFKIIKHTCLDKNKREARIPTVNVEEPFDLTDIVNSPENNIENIDLYSALKTLTDEENEILYLKFWEGLTVREIAKRIRKPKSTVQYILEQSLKKIAAFMDKEP